MSSLVRKRSDAIQDKVTYPCIVNPSNLNPTFMYFMGECQKITFNLEMALLHEKYVSFSHFNHSHMARYM